MPERDKGYDTSEEFPQNLWYFVILLQDWDLSPRNSQLYGVTKTKHLISIDSQTGWPKHTRSKHIICMTIFHADFLGNERGKIFLRYQGESDTAWLISWYFFGSSPPQGSSFRFLDSWLHFPRVSLPSLENQTLVFVEAPRCHWPHHEECFHPHPSRGNSAGNPALILYSF